ncbi:MAG: hypothetical protein B7O98_03340 [Zestosphaera tikiterensis]|uniref:Tyrosine recombinase XerA n=1 Tax=Zestosphaera tikiterensis TaxID=1973259 RepID=A0A2R7Y7E0_9CREN|nr:MAG: hypothetical protein B7O98_03340 [Zestosphaera tikiterensis]
MVRFELPEAPEEVREESLWKALEVFLTYLEGTGASPKTVKAYKHGIKDFIKFINKEKVKDLTPEDFNKWKLERLRSGFIKGSKDKRRIQTTLHYYSLYVRSFLSWLGIVKKAPAVARPKGKKVIQALSNEEIYKMLNASRDILDLLILALMFETGLRAQELLSLNVEDINLSTKEILVKNAKFGEERIVFFGSLSEKVLKEYLSRYGVNQGKLINISYNGLYKRLKTLAKKAGVDPAKVRPHILRHTFATEALRRGVNIIALQALLGHKDLKTTQVYLHLLKEDLKKLYEAAFNYTPQTLNVSNAAISNA